MIETLLNTLLNSLTEYVHWAGYLLAGILIRNIWWALAAGLGWALLIEAGGWIIYPSASVGWYLVGPPLAALVATAVVWWLKCAIRRALSSRKS